MGDKEVLKYNGIVLLESDLDILLGPCYLTDQIIAFYFTYLSSTCKPDIDHTDDFLFVNPSVSFWLANCEDELAAVSEFAESNSLSTKKLALFVVNDCKDFSDGDKGSNHWSILVYFRTMNAFMHFDSCKGLNKGSAEKLYEIVKAYTGPGCARPQQNAQNSKKRLWSVFNQETIASSSLPIFREWEKTPQQSNTYDCGIYVLAIAEVLWKSYLNKTNGDEDDVLKAILDGVDHSVEVLMRREVLDVIQDLRTN